MFIPVPNNMYIFHVHHYSFDNAITWSFKIDDTSIFTRTRGALNIKDQAADQPIKRLGPTSNILRVMS
jgi:hypothetical protein